MHNLLVDIGSHTGEALEEALRPIYDIDCVFAIEPSSFGIEKISRFKDRRVRIFPIAVSNYNGNSTLFSAGSVGGGLFSDKHKHWRGTEIVRVIKFSEWAILNLNGFENIYIKINVEGSELFILQEIIKIHKKFNFKSILLSIDIEKVPSLSIYKDELYSLVSNFPIPITIREDKEINLAIMKWLVKSNLRQNKKRNKMRDLLRSYLPYERNLLRIFKPFIPKNIWVFVALKIGPNRAK